MSVIFFFKQKTACDIGLGIPAEPPSDLVPFGAVVYSVINIKLMDELAQCYNVLPQLDINNTIDHRPEGDEKWFLENEKTVTQFCRKLAAERPLKDIQIGRASCRERV